MSVVQYMTVTVPRCLAYYNDDLINARTLDPDASSYERITDMHINDAFNSLYNKTKQLGNDAFGFRDELFPVARSNIASTFAARVLTRRARINTNDQGRGGHFLTNVSR